MRCLCQRSDLGSANAAQRKQLWPAFRGKGGFVLHAEPCTSTFGFGGSTHQTKLANGLMAACCSVHCWCFFLTCELVLESPTSKGQERSLLTKEFDAAATMPSSKKWNPLAQLDIHLTLQIGLDRDLCSCSFLGTLGPIFCCHQRQTFSSLISIISLLFLTSLTLVNRRNRLTLRSENNRSSNSVTQSRVLN